MDKIAGVTASTSAHMGLSNLMVKWYPSLEFIEGNSIVNCFLLSNVIMIES